MTMKIYEKPEFNIELIENSDIITTSPGTEMRQISETDGIWDLNQTV